MLLFSIYQLDIQATHDEKKQIVYLFLFTLILTDISFHRMEKEMKKPKITVYHQMKNLQTT
jgi:hypothetical protein